MTKHTMCMYTSWSARVKYLANFWNGSIERLSNYKLKILRMDNGSKYISREFCSFLKKEGIRQEVRISKHPEQNGVSERLSRTLLESVRSMLADTQLPHKFWIEALSTAFFWGIWALLLLFLEYKPGAERNQVWIIWKYLGVQHTPIFQRMKEENWILKCVSVSFLVMEIYRSMMQSKLV